LSIYINTNQQTSGPFEESAVVAWLRAGKLSPDVLACRHGASQWLPLRDLLSVLGINAFQQSNAPTQARTCEKCGQREGDIYSFHYGKKIRGSTRMVSYTSNKYVTSYQMAGRRDVAVCDECLRRRRMNSLITSGLMVAVGAIVGLGGLLLGARVGARSPVPLCLMSPGLFFALIGLPSLSHTLSSKNADYGLSTAIDLKKGELQRQGFDTFWGPEKFRRSQRS
jgi:GYF domain 2